jgi:hypothetical protein
MIGNRHPAYLASYWLPFSKSGRGQKGSLFSNQKENRPDTNLSRFPSIQ